MKTKEELDALKKEVEAVGEKLRELTDEELKQVVGGGTDYSRKDGVSLSIEEGEYIIFNGVH